MTRYVPGELLQQVDNKSLTHVGWTDRIAVDIERVKALRKHNVDEYMFKDEDGVDAVVHIYTHQDSEVHIFGNSDDIYDLFWKCSTELAKYDNKNVITLEWTVYVNIYESRNALDNDDDFDDEPQPIDLECDECMNETHHLVAYTSDDKQGWTCSSCWPYDVPVEIKDGNGVVIEYDSPFCSVVRQ